MNRTSNSEMFNRDPKTAQMGKEILPFEMGYLPDFFQRKAEVELGDTQENRQKALKILKELMENDKNLSNVNFDDDILLQFLRCTKLNVKKSFTQLKAFVNFRKDYQYMFEDFHFEKMENATTNKLLSFLPYRCQDGCAIIMVKFDNWIPEELPIEDLKRMAVIFLLQSLRDPMTQVNGFKAIIDMKSNPLRHLKYCTPSNMHLLYRGTQEVCPGRFKGLHYINVMLTMQVAWAILKVFVSSKVKKRIHFHDNPEELLDYFPSAVLPVEYGGELKEYDSTDWLKDVMSPAKMATLGGFNYSVS